MNSIAKNAKSQLFGRPSHASSFMLVMFVKIFAKPQYTINTVNIISILPRIAKDAMIIYAFVDKL